MAQWFDKARLEDPSYRKELQIQGLEEPAREVPALLQHERDVDNIAPGNILPGRLSQGCAMSLTVLLAVRECTFERGLLSLPPIEDPEPVSWFSSRSYSPWAPVHNALAAMIDSGRAPDATDVVMTADGIIVSTSSDVSKDVTPGTYYAPPDDYQLSRSSSSSSKVATVPRDRLIELGRLAPFTNVVAPISSPSERLVFKHYEDDKVMTDVWASRAFKLKWAKQLFQALDDLNLQHGINHQDIHLRNLMVDPVTDNLMIIDLGIARRRGLIDGTLPQKKKSKLPTDRSWETESNLWNGEGIDTITAGPWTALRMPASTTRLKLTTRPLPTGSAGAAPTHATATGRQHPSAFPNTCPSPEATRSACWITSARLTPLATKNQWPKCL
ncbi:hypothetical protein B0T25DRAFT_586040 [Lasiosphaeria hispida]|uniref:Protein kinase domain-containing protein n=1 Tax=Lasiosphaeria hispida TaxID=260671 RepID=A0AAJ0H796_9PEZI|nr:hypothetical protein B0T25DRAFT_586040 [Lasiosphaeria hispida]